MDLALIASNPEAYNSSSPLSMLPGDIAFSTLDWFGISGTNVVFTASVSNNMVFPSSPPYDAASVTSSPPYPLGAWLPPAASASYPSQTQSPSPSLAGWQLAVAIVGSVIGATLVVMLVSLFVIRSKQRSFHSKVSIESQISTSRRAVDEMPAACMLPLNRLP